MFHVTAATATASAIITTSFHHHHHHFDFEPILQHAVSTTTTTSTLAALTCLRGGGGHSPVLPTSSSSDVHHPNFDIDRVRMRLDGLNSYAVISTLTMNACLGLYFKTPKQQLEPQDTTSQKLAKVMFMLSTVISIISASYTTVVFTLLGLYSKTALGLSDDHGPFLEFFAQTAIFRQLAFTAFCISLVSFQTCFISSLFLSHDFLRWYATGLASALTIFCFWQWGMIINLAGRLLFKSNH